MTQATNPRLSDRTVEALDHQLYGLKIVSIGRYGDTNHLSILLEGGYKLHITDAGTNLSWETPSH